jgi:hypothetical protein
MDLFGRSRRTAARLFVTVAVCSGACAAARVGQVAAPPPDRVWQVAERPRSGPEVRGESAIVRLNKAALDDLLRDAPREGSGKASRVIVALPMPDGTFARFRVVESVMLAPELAAAFPDIRTYSGQGLDDPTATTRFGWTAAGFHAVVIGSSGSVYIDPYTPGDVEHYISFRKAR